MKQNIINLICLIVLIFFICALFDDDVTDTQENNTSNEIILLEDSGSTTVIENDTSQLTVDTIDTEKYDCDVTEIVTGNIVLLEYIPPFLGKPYVEVDSNIPSFTEEELTTVSFELYSELDYLGRPSVAYANVGPDIMPTEERGEIGQIKPAGWHTVKYDCIDGLYLYNRCHLIGYQLTGENDNINNLMTGTRYLNVQGMLTFENMVADYVLETGNHVLYRVTPVYEGDNLIATGVQMEGYSVEDNGAGICYNVFCYNSQPGIVIDYKNGDSYKESTETTEVLEYNTSDDFSTEEIIHVDYVVNKNTDRFHYPHCSSVSDMKEKNKWYYNGTRQMLIDKGYIPCGNCKP